MTVYILSAAGQLGRQLKRLHPDDVIIFRNFRIVPAMKPSHGFWLEGYGDVRLFAPDRGVAAAMRRAIDIMEMGL